MNLDRFRLGSDPQDKALTICSACLNDIYEQELVYITPDGDILHRDAECLKHYFNIDVKPIEETLRR